ncbi:MAG: D-alanyl-D-alanine carboxypeptidase [SAR324 cluster bacterium]|nr:D-alanyl-D-alanine carboxypeptidase [SAR324 cluster bacterium]
MTKKPYQIFFILVLSFVFSKVVLSPSLLAQPLLIKDNQELYKAAIVMEPTTGTILHAENSQKLINPASIVKMMVSLIVLEHLQEKQIKLTDQITVSKWASKIGGHQVFLKQGEVFELGELMRAVVIGSANDAAVSVAEYIGGDQQGFVEMMNRRAQKLKMKDTIYQNPHGLPPGRGQQETITTAYDQALLGQELLKHPQYIKWSSVRRDMFRNNTFELLNTNRHLLKKMPEVDGLKTGYHRKAGFSVVATAKRGDTRLIAAVMGAKKTSIRTKIAARLLARGFSKYGYVTVLHKGETFKQSVSVKKGQSETVDLILAETARFFLKRSDHNKIEQRINLPESIEAPVIEGKILGNIELKLNDKILQTIDLHAAKSVTKKTFWQNLKESLKL